jgi:hypothetical protein
LNRLFKLINGLVFCRKVNILFPFEINALQRGNWRKSGFSKNASELSGVVISCGIYLIFRG